MSIKYIKLTHGIIIDGFCVDLRACAINNCTIIIQMDEKIDRSSEYKWISPAVDK